MADEQKPWERLDGEPNQWFRRFESFKLMGPDRSLQGAYNLERVQKGSKKSAGVSGSWQRAAQRWSWRARAEAWDSLQSALVEEEWLKRAAEHRESEWQARSQLLQKAQEMMGFPLATAEEQRAPDGSMTVIIHPVKGWTLREAVAMLELSSKLGRLATGQGTEKVTIDLQTAAREAGIDPEDPVIRETINAIVEKIIAAKTGRVDNGPGSEGGSGEDRAAGTSSESDTSQESGVA